MYFSRAHHLKVIFTDLTPKWKSLRSDSLH